MTALKVREVAGLSDLGELCADEIVRLCESRQAAGEVPCIALTGGRAGAAVLASLAARASTSAVNWSRVRLIWGDERWLPSGDAERNDRLADETLFQAAAVDEALVHRVASGSSGFDLDAAAAAYSMIVAGISRIDLVLCGVGEDGHVASLFPERDDLLVSDAGTPQAIAVRDSPKAPAERVTLSLSALNRAECVWLLACGEGKAEAVADLRSRRVPLVPAARVFGHTETVLWADAAALG